MSDGITVYCPSCGHYAALHKEYETYNHIDVYNCPDCKKKFAIELVVKKQRR
jgi:transposase-like protein